MSGVRRLISDESGLTMGIVVITIVLIGVMGAGLLVFVQRNMEGLLTVNQGQRAFETTDAGIEAARRQLYSVDQATLTSGAESTRYDGGPDDFDWSYADRDGVGPDKPGRDLTFDGNPVNVQIRYLPPVAAPLVPTQNQAPETIPVGKTKLDSGCRYFKVTSEGAYGDARRKIEAILCATARGDTALAYYTPKDVTFSGNVHVSGVSFFAGGNIIGSNSGSVSFDRTTQALHGDWDTTKYFPPSFYNTTPRRNTLNQPVVGAGLGAEGRVCNGNNCAVSAADNINTYDSTTAKKFVRKTPPDSTPQPSTQISYPFDPVNPIDENILKEEAQLQGRYYTGAQDITAAMFPATQSDQAVVYINAQGGSVSYRARIATGNVRGTVVVENGNLDISNSASPFAGVMVVTGNGTTTGQFKNTGNLSVEGFVLADGNMTIRGTVAPLAVSETLFFRPAIYKVYVWSWRELYE